MTHPRNKAKPKPRLFNDLGLYKTEFEIREDVTMNEDKETELGFVKKLVQSVKELISKNEKVVIVDKKEHKEVLASSVNEADLIKDRLVREVVSLQIERQRIIDETDNKIIGMVRCGAKEIGELKGGQFDIDVDGWDITTLDNLQGFSYKPNKRPVKNENFGIAKKLFQDALDKNAISKEDSFVKAALLQFEETSNGNIKTASIHQLLMLDFSKHFKNGEWDVIKTKLERCYEYRPKKMAFKSWVRKSLLHIEQRITEGYKPIEDFEFSFKKEA